jgi:hypothetical protein
MGHNSESRNNLHHGEVVSAGFIGDVRLISQAVLMGISGASAPPT